MGFLDLFKRKPAIPEGALMLWVHRRQLLELHRRMSGNDGRELLPLVPLNDAFSACLAATTTDGPVPLTGEDLDAMKLDFAQAVTVAMGNLAPHFSQSYQAEGLCLFPSKYQFAGGALLIASALAPKLPIKGRAVVMLPRADLALMAGEEDEPALRRMIDMAESEYESDEYRSLFACIVTDGPRPAPWLPPKGHPLRARFAAAAAETRRRDAKELYGLYARDEAPSENLPVPGLDKPALAPLAVVPDGDDARLVAAWFRDANVVIPEVDRVVLLDTDDGPDARLEVEFETLRGAFGSMFEEVRVEDFLADEEEDETAEPSAEEEDEERPVLWRTRGTLFPSHRERAFLKARTAWDAAHAERDEREVPAAELLAAWDAGAPILAEPSANSSVRLNAPDRRAAEIALKEIRPRIDQLPALDQAIFHTGLMSAAFLQIMMKALDPEGAAKGAGEDAPPSAESIQQMQERARSQRPELLTSTLVQRYCEKLKEESADENMAALVENATSMLDPGRLLPIVRTPEYLEGSKANYSGMVAHLAKEGSPVNVVGPKRLMRPFVDGLSFELVADAGNQVLPVNAEFVPDSWHEPAWRSALLNLRAYSLQPMKQAKVAGVFEGPWRDDFDASRMLLQPDLATSCAVRGEPLVFAPTLGSAWVTGTEDEAGIAAVLDAIEAMLASGEATTPYQFRQLLFGWPWLVRDGKPQRWNPPASHPSAPRIAALDETLAKRRSTSVERVGAFAASVAFGGKEPSGRQ